MREILFRGKRVDDVTWIEGFLFSTKDHTYIAYQNQFDDDLFLSPKEIFIEVDPKTVCQYTGLTDKNGRKIFEGDILSAYLDDQHPEDITYVQITWDGFSWCMRESTEDDVMSEYDCNTFEVCGNIFDNPELIGE